MHCTFSGSWAVHTTLNPAFCNALVDFNVPGKPNPPPNKLTATVWTQSHFVPKPNSGTLLKNAIEFTDPSGKLGSHSVPLNTWVVSTDDAIDLSDDSKAPENCIEGSPLVFIDMHDGDKKVVKLNGTTLTIEPIGSSKRLLISTCDP